jgi:hypothetical protein
LTGKPWKTYLFLNSFKITPGLPAFFRPPVLGATNKRRLCGRTLSSGQLSFSVLFILAIDIINNGGLRSPKKVMAVALRPAAAAALLHLHALQFFNPVNPSVKNDKTELQATVLKKNLC